MISEFQQSGRSSMTNVLEQMLMNFDSEHTTIEQIIDQLKYRGFGPLLAVPALFVIVVGAIPLVPALIGLVISFISIQMLIGKMHPWMPKKIMTLKVNKNKLERFINYAKPFTKKLDRLLKNRFLFVFNRVSEMITAITCLILAVAMITIGFIPFVPAMLAIPIFLFGIGYTAQDGLLVIIGFLIILGSCWLWLT